MYDEIMKRCRAGTTTYEAANDLHAQCFGAIGRLRARVEELEAENERLWKRVERLQSRQEKGC